MSSFNKYLEHVASFKKRMDIDSAIQCYKIPFTQLFYYANLARINRFKENAKYATYIIERNINYTNICVTACKFCSFYRPITDKNNTWVRSLDEILQACKETIELGGTQVMIQGGHHPNFKIEYYEKMFQAIKNKYPNLIIHSLGGSEINHISNISNISIQETITRLKASGLDSLAGAGSEILTEKTRKRIAPLKESGTKWIYIMEQAHKLGLRSTATMLLGVGESIEERIEHLSMIRNLQDNTGGFRSFIPYVFQRENNILGKIYKKLPFIEYLQLLAISRLFFDNIEHLQGSWLTVGKIACEMSLHCGADDLGSLMIEENVVSSAGVSNRMDLKEMIHIIKSAGRVPIERNTQYEYLQNKRDIDKIKSHIHSKLTKKQYQ